MSVLLGLSRVGSFVVRGRPRLALPTVAVIGDSHAGFLTGHSLRPVSTSPDCQLLTIWMGPKLMHSIAREGFRFSVRQRVALLVHRVTIIIFVFGEIDVRVHLAKRKQERTALQEWVAAYVERARSLAKTLNCSEIIFLAPPPPSDSGCDNAEFPRSGSLAERVAVRQQLTRNLIKAAEATGDLKMSVFDVGPYLSSEAGVLASDLTDDGVHLNLKGRKHAWQAVVRAHPNLASFTHRIEFF